MNNMKAPSQKPELLRDRQERALLALLRAIVLAHPEEVGRHDVPESVEKRVRTALSALLGSSKDGRPGLQRDELLEHLAFDYSVQTRHEGRDVSVTKVATMLVAHHPLTAGRDPEGSIVRDLVRKFERHEDELLKAHAFDGEEGLDVLHEPVARALFALADAGVAVDLSVVPPGARQRRDI
jgi:hypothetical protein